MRTSCLRLIGLVVVLSAAVRAAPPLDARTTVLPSYWLPADAKADGSLEKWRGIPPAVGPEKFKQGETDVALVPSDDFAPMLYIGRRRGSADLFVLLVVKDRCVRPGESAGWIFGDCLEVFVDVGREARAKASPDWWKDVNRWANVPEMTQIGCLPVAPGHPGQLIRAPGTIRKWGFDYASVPVRGGFVYEIRLDGASVLQDLKLAELPREMGVDVTLRAVDYPVSFDGGGWANHRGYYRLFGNWTAHFSPVNYGGLCTAPLEPTGTSRPGQTLASIYGASPTFEDLRAAIAKGAGEPVAELLYLLACKGQLPDAELVTQVLALDSPAAREVCLTLMLDPRQNVAARQAAADRAYTGAETATARGLIAANLLERELGHGHGALQITLLRHADLTVVVTAAQALAANGTKADLAPAMACLQEALAAAEKDPAQKTRLAVLRGFVTPALAEMQFRLEPPPPPRATPLVKLEAKNSDLPRIFGVDNNTAYNGAGLLRRWGAGQPRELWRAKVGSGWPAVTEAGGRAFTMGMADGKTWGYCFNAADGKLLWRQMVRATENGHTAATPLLDGTERVYFSGLGAVVCLRQADGSEVWREEKAYSGVGFSTPVLAGDLLLVPGQTLVAVDKLTGQVRWRTPGPAASPASPALQRLDGIDQVILGVGGNETSEVWGISLKDGQVFWKFPGRGGYGLCTSPVVVGSRVLLAGGETGREYFIALQMLVKDGAIRALPALTCSDLEANYAHTMTVWDGAVYGFGGGGLECADPATGRVFWRDRGGWKNDLQLIAADGLLFIQNATDLVLAEATKNGYRENGRLTLPVKTVQQQPTLANGRLYVRGDSWIVCYAVRDSEPAPAAPVR